jgi:tetratricopeptide (TPR) repeat protein
MKPLPQSDILTLSASEGWLILNDAKETFRELERVSEESRLHPATLVITWKALFLSHQYDAALQVARGLCEREPDLPFGWLCCGQSLAQRGELQAAKNILLSVEPSFAGNKLIPYNIACYASRLGQMDEALDWLFQALARDEGLELLESALEDPDLESLRRALRGL